jgi:GGDEF domain-containing protein
MITRPLGELTEGAQAIAEGRFGHEIPVRSKDEVGSLAKVFNEMSSELSDTMDQLNSSRDQLQIAIRRVGETLRSTHDMTQLRESIVNTSADAVGADAAILWTFSSTREELLPTVVRGAMDAHVDRVKVGTGIVGMVAERAISMMLPSEESGPEPAPGEPDFHALIATPVFTRDGVTSVLVNYRRMIAFTSRDMETVKFLAEQGGVAIENVLLHEDAHRMSLTDGLTGVWNRRYLQMQSRQVQATSVRFSREFSVLMLDLDRFKKINDTCGHPRGDAILVEVARRVNETLREVDTFARYGGEEFVCLEVIRSRPFGGEGEEEAIGLTLSIGIATFPEAGDSFKSLLEAADQALYRAKQEGRDRYCVAGNQPGAACADAG